MRASGRCYVAVDDDPALLAALRRGFRRSGIEVFTATSGEHGRVLVREHRPEVAIVDLRIGDEWGLDLVTSFKAELPSLVVVMLSGYLSVASTVSAIRSGADHVFFKPVSCREILQRIAAPNPCLPQELETPSLARAEWEHMMRVLDDCEGNISEAARRLRLHRQNLQRRLRKNAPL